MVTLPILPLRLNDTFYLEELDAIVDKLPSVMDFCHEAWEPDIESWRYIHSRLLWLYMHRIMVACHHAFEVTRVGLAGHIPASLSSLRLLLPRESTSFDHEKSSAGVFVRAMSWKPKGLPSWLRVCMIF